jgi:thiamine-monophosphate kinase
MNEATILDMIAKTACMPKSVGVGPGDDLAVLEIGGATVMVGVDQVIVGRHVTPGTSWETIGRKAANRSLSDVAAMAGRPVALLATGAVSKKTTDEDAIAFLRGLRSAADAVGIPLVGGDLATLSEGDDGSVVTVTVLAEPTARGPVLRSGGCPGDSLYVTGVIGGAWAAPGADHHLTFDPRIAEALELQERCTLHAMIDISDGLGRDAARLAMASHCHGEIDLAAVPVAEGVTPRAAIEEGEEYELLFAASGRVPDVLSSACSVTKIGRLIDGTDSACAVSIRDGDMRWAGDELGWTHQ